jgi:hypothetical protein
MAGTGGGVLKPDGYVIRKALPDHDQFKEDIFSLACESDS